MKVEVLGTAQDGGVPHLGCECENCEKARESGDLRYVNSLMLKEDDVDGSIQYLVGATPDIRFQVKGKYLDGVFVSDRHLADMVGLLQFGPAVQDASKIPVYSSPDVKEYINRNDPFRLLIDRENIESHALEPGEAVDLQGGSITPIHVNHYGDTPTLAFMIEGNEKKLFYMTHTDEWRKNNFEKVKEADIAIVDGCFWSKDEIDRYEEVLHPPIKESIEKLADLDTEIYFTHMNHTNPVLREDSEERQELEQKGFKLAERGMEFEI